MVVLVSYFYLGVERLGDCGVVGISLKNGGSGVASNIYSSLASLENRGPHGCGIATFHPSRETSKIRVHKSSKNLGEGFHESDEVEFRRIMEFLNGSVGIGHIRWATSGGSLEDRLEEAQPFHRRHGKCKRTNLDHSIER